MNIREELELFEKDNSYEINNFTIVIEQLQKARVSNFVLASEIYLRKFYGDEIYASKVVDEEDEQNEKKVQKLAEEDMGIDKDYKEICEDIDNSEFDKNLDEFLSTNG